MYRKSLLTFMDILGFKAFVNRSDPDEIRRILHRFREAADPGKDPPFPMQFFNFSDTNIRATYLDEKDSYKRPNGLMFYELLNVSIIQVDLIRDGIFLRGSVTVGNLYCEDNMIFGPALIRGYELEQSVSLYPRITVDPEVIKLYRDSQILWGHDHDYEADKEYTEGYLRKDIDGVYYIDYAAALGEQFDREGEFADFLATHKLMIETQGAKLKSFDSIGIKFNWLVEYHNSTVQKFANPIEGVPHKDLLIDPSILPFRHDL